MKEVKSMSSQNDKDFLKVLEEKLMDPLEKLSRQKHLAAIRDGLSNSTLIISITTFFLIIAYPPIPQLNQYLSQIVEVLTYPVSIAMGFVSVIVSFSVAQSLASIYETDELYCGFISTLSFLMASSFHLPYLGMEGIFLAILVGLLTTEVYRLLQLKKSIIKLPPEVPPGVTSAFRCLIPGAFMFTIVWIIRDILSFDLILMSNALFNEFFWIMDTLPLVTIAEFLEVVFWSIGLHGDSIVESITGPFMIIYDLKNVEAKVLGVPLPHVYGNTFHTCYAVPGGSGCTMGLALLYLRSKSKRLRKIGKLGFMSGIFNINEPITFGTPIVMNPLMVVPFVVVSTLNSFIAYYLISMGLIQRFYVIVPW
ncbi:MAG: PTS sugar transporter subunit IIC, partial [Candidatus Odinarchaeota archaeon]|nr:PTS sugar transporter subunit IIC [Candidatus Odinarchaeota archaeon]